MIRSSVWSTNSRQQINEFIITETILLSNNSIVNRRSSPSAAIKCDLPAASISFSPSRSFSITITGLARTELLCLVWAKTPKLLKQNKYEVQRKFCSHVTHTSTNCHKSREGHHDIEWDFKNKQRILQGYDIDWEIKNKAYFKKVTLNRHENNLFIIYFPTNFKKSLYNHSITKVYNIHASVRVSCVIFDDMWLIAHIISSMHLTSAI